MEWLIAFKEWLGMFLNVFFILFHIYLLVRGYRGKFFFFMFLWFIVAMFIRLGL